MTKQIKKKEEELDGDKLSQLEKKLSDELGKGVIFRGDDSTHFTSDVLKTGIISVDKMLGGGIPRGRLTELYGSEGCGKTTLALQFIEYQTTMNKDFAVLYIDSEHALNIKYVASLGIKMSNFWIAQPSSAEEALELIYKVSEEKMIDMIILDSVAALIPKSEIDNDMGDVQVASLARTLSSCLKKIVSTISKSNTALIFINQLRSNVSSFGFGMSNEATTGGKALKYFTSMRIELTRSSLIRNKENIPVGHMLKIRTTKNKIAMPYQDSLLELYFGKGVSKIVDMIQIGLQRSIITKSGTYFYLDNKSFQGRDNLIKAIEENSELCNKLFEAVNN